MTDKERISSKKEDLFLFAGEEKEVGDISKKNVSKKKWKVIIADDEEEIHSITRMVLGDYFFEGQGLQFLSSYTGEETKKLIEDNPDAAILLLDVVMETDDAGLRVVKYIREKLANPFIRIILRTGQPGKAPEKKVIMEYDINEYKEKTELTSQKLYTTITSALRSYKGLKTIERNRNGLKHIISSSPQLFGYRSLQVFVSGVFPQLMSLLRIDSLLEDFEACGFATSYEKGEHIIIAAIGGYEKDVGKNIKEVLTEDILAMLDKSISKKTSFFSDREFIGYYFNENGSKNLMFLRVTRELTEIDKDLINVFSTNIAVALDNIYLNQEIVETQKEVITTLGEVVETRSKETAYHVSRVAEFSYVMALDLGMDRRKAQMLRHATPMHDVGKIGIPDDVLNKPGRYTPEEAKLMEDHTLIGYEILKNSRREIFRIAAIVALQHHEKWDGTGYPQGLKGEDIHIYGRITALADVFDALSHKRIYKPAWEIEKVVDYIKSERGKQFDPKIVDAFIENLDEFIEINNHYVDE